MEVLLDDYLPIDIVAIRLCCPNKSGTDVNIGRSARCFEVAQVLQASADAVESSM